jgi:hypothetical protein
VATPPFNLDISDPTDGALGNAFPQNERTFRDNVNTYINTEHDINTGWHKFQELTTTQKNALSSPPTGMLVWDTSFGSLFINTGTPGSPVWTQSAGNASGWLYKLKANGSGSYTATAGDTGTLFHSGSAGGTLTVTLPDTSLIVDGWYAGFQRRTNGMTVAVNGGHSEHMLCPDGLALTTAALYPGDYEFMLLVFDGTNFNVISISSGTYQLLNSLYNPAHPGLGGQAFTSNGGFTIPAGVTKLKITVSGGGGGGGGGAGGTSAASAGSSGSASGTAIKYLTGLTPGGTLTVTIGAGGSSGTGGIRAGGDGGVGGNGGDSSVASGTQSISTITGGGGLGGNGGQQTAGGGAGVAGGTATGGDINAHGLNSYLSGNTLAFSTNIPGNFLPAFGAGGQGGGPAFGGADGFAGQVGYAGIALFEWWN